MMEKRSFDHMLGFLNDAAAPYEWLRHQYPNRLDPDDSSPEEGVSDDATYVLHVDPPRSHHAAMEQMNLSATGKTRMRLTNGQLRVSAMLLLCALAALGRELRPPTVAGLVLLATAIRIDGRARLESPRV